MGAPSGLVTLHCISQPNNCGFIIPLSVLGHFNSMTLKPKVHTQYMHHNIKHTTKVYRKEVAGSGEVAQHAKIMARFFGSDRQSEASQSRFQIS